jgi:hypothetical protein
VGSRADWWAKSGAALPSLAGLPLEAGNAALAFPVPASAWIDPAAAAALTERYNVRFEALWRSAATGAADPHAAQGPSGAAPDRRFLAREWREYPYFAWLKNVYLLYADYLRELADLAQGDNETRKRVLFMARQYANAIAPSNFLATNPEAIAAPIRRRLLGRGWPTCSPTAARPTPFPTSAFAGRNRAHPAASSSATADRA